MIKFIIPAIIVFLIVLFWENINEFVYKKFNIKINEDNTPQLRNMAEILLQLSKNSDTFKEFFLQI